MSLFLLYALTMSVFGVAVSLHFGNKTLLRVVLHGGLTFATTLILGYLSPNFFYGPFWGMTVSLFCVGFINTALAYLTPRDWEAFRPDVVIPKGTLVFVAFLVVVLLRGCAGSGVFHASDYQALLGPVETRNWNDDIQPVDPTHIRPVSLAQAQWLGDKVIGEAEGSLGSRYQFGDYSIQRVRGELYWVSPLEFLGFSKWQTYDHTTGFVMVSAEDRMRKPEFFDGFKMRYMPSAFFGDNLERYVYTHGYAFHGLTEYSFEVDDNHRPWWVITVFHPTIAWWGDVVDGVIIINPETGEVLPGNGQVYAPEEVPDWVDRVYPESFTEDYITYWGKYIQGWLNSWWQKENVQVPTPFGGDSNNVVLIYGEDGEPKWFTGLTSASSTDQSLTGFMLVDSRTGKATQYQISGPNEEAVLDAVNNAVSNFTGWHGTTPIPYNIYGEFTWGVPVVSANNIFQRMALVRQSSATVVLGNDVADALRNYRSALLSNGFSAAPSAQADLRTLTNVRVSRMGVEPSGDNTLYYLYFLEEPTKAFTAPSGISAELPLTQVGDRVSVSFVETQEAQAPMDSFDNKELELTTSEPQKELDQRREEVSQERDARDTKRDVRRDLDNLSPKELEAVQQVLKERRQNNN